MRRISPPYLSLPRAAFPPFFPCSAPHFPPFFPRFTSHLSPGPLSPPRGGERFLRSFFQKATLPSPLLPIPAPVCSVSCIPPSCVLRFLYSHPPVCSVSCISTPPVCCVFRIPAPHGSGNFPLPGLDRCRPLCYTVHKNTVLQRRQFVTILSVNKTREKDGRIAPFLFCRVWERGQNRPAKKEGAPCAEKGKKNGKKNMKPIACC